MILTHSAPHDPAQPTARLWYDLGYSRAISDWWWLLIVAALAGLAASELWPAASHLPAGLP